MKKRIVPLAVIALGLLASCGKVYSSVTAGDGDFSYSFNEYKDIDIHTDLQNQYLNDSIESVETYARGYEEVSKPNDLEITWEFKTFDSKRVSLYTFYLSESEDMVSPVVYEYDDTVATLSNLKVGTTYYYQIEAEAGNRKYKSTVQSFNTLATTPRNLDIGGVTNARDMGGYTTSDGKHVKQNMVIRSGQFNERYTDSLTPTITGMGKEFLRDVVGIRTELDLRTVDDGETGHMEHLGKSLIGNDVKYVSLPLENEISKTHINEKEQFKNIFKVFADEKSYPIVFHCAIGTDRTGVTAYFLGALLGIDHDTLCRDYLFSNFGLINGTRNLDNPKIYNKYLMGLEGATLKEKTYNYFLDIGMTSSELDNIRNILLY